MHSGGCTPRKEEAQTSSFLMSTVVGVRSCSLPQSVLHRRQRCDSGAIPQAYLTCDGAQALAAFAVCSRDVFIAAAAGVLTLLELIERLAALIRPPRRHRHRDRGVLAPNAPLCSAVTAPDLPGSGLTFPIHRPLGQQRQPMW
jgi:hypothetical protein